MESYADDFMKSYRSVVNTRGHWISSHPTPTKVEWLKDTKTGIVHLVIVFEDASKMEIEGAGYSVAPTSARS